MPAPWDVAGDAVDALSTGLSPLAGEGCRQSEQEGVSEHQPEPYESSPYEQSPYESLPQQYNQGKAKVYGRPRLDAGCSADAVPFLGEKGPIAKLRKIAEGKGWKQGDKEGLRVNFHVEALGEHFAAANVIFDAYLYCDDGSYYYASEFEPSVFINAGVGGCRSGFDMVSIDGNTFYFYFDDPIESSFRRQAANIGPTYTFWLQNGWVGDGETAKGVFATQLLYQR